MKAAHITMLVAFLLFTGTARAEFGTPYVTPSHPAPGEPVSLNLYQGGCDGITGPDNPEVTLEDSFIYVLAQGQRYTNPELCFFTYGIATFAIGAYPSGHYTLQLDLRYPNPGGTFVIETLGIVPFTVGGAEAVPVPVSGAGRLLAMGLGLMALMRLRRRAQRADG